MKNTYSVPKFIFANIYSYFIVWFGYRALLFRTIEGLSSLKSFMLLVFVLVASLVIGFITQRKSRMNSFSVAINVLIGYGLYTLISYLPIKKSLIITVLSFVGISVSLYALYLFTCKRNNSTLYKMFCKRASTFVRGSQALVAIGMMIIMLVPCISMNGTSGITQAKSTIPSISSEETIANNMDCLSKLEYDEWCYLSIEKKLDVLQTIANIERRYLGIPHELNVVAKYMENSSILGCYADSTHTISVSFSSIMYDEPFEVVDTICHESYHAYQHCLVEMYNECPDKYKGLKVNRRTKLYSEEFADYASGYSDFCTYYTQACEEDAREYAESATNDYYNKISECINAQ